MPWETDVAWAAGLFEGEGCFTHKRYPQGYVYPQAYIDSTDKDVLERFSAILDLPIPKPRKAEKGRKQAYYIQIQGFDKVGLLASKIGKYLGERRLSRLREVLTEAEYAV